MRCERMVSLTIRGQTFELTAAEALAALDSLRGDLESAPLSPGLLSDDGGCRWFDVGLTPIQIADVVC